MGRSVHFLLKMSPVCKQTHVLIDAGPSFFTIPSHQTNKRLIHLSLFTLLSSVAGKKVYVLFLFPAGMLPVGKKEKEEEGEVTTFFSVLLSPLLVFALYSSAPSFR